MSNFKAGWGKEVKSHPNYVHPKRNLTGATSWLWCGGGGGAGEWAAVPLLSFHPFLQIPTGHFTILQVWGQGPHYRSYRGYHLNELIIYIPLTESSSTVEVHPLQQPPVSQSKLIHIHSATNIHPVQADPHPTPHQILSQSPGKLTGDGITFRKSLTEPLTSSVSRVFFESFRSNT